MWFLLIRAGEEHFLIDGIDFAHHLYLDHLKHTCNKVKKTTTKISATFNTIKI